METRTRGKRTIDRGLRGSVETLDDMIPTRLSKRSQGCPLTQCLVEGARCSVETQAITTQLPAYVVEFRSIFTKEDFNMLPEHHKWDHAIELTPGAEPKSSKVYPLSPLE